MNLISRLLRKNISTPRIIGFVLSNFIGLVIVAGGLQFYLDAKSIWDDEDSFIKSDFMVVNKRVTSSATLGNSTTSFTSAELEDISRQPWVRKAGAFSSADFKVKGSVSQGGRGMSTYMFFESIPDDFVDVDSESWRWNDGDTTLPIIISKDYLTLYNFGFAGSAGLPQMSESIMSGIPLDITMTSDDGTRRVNMTGRVVGFSNRLNTILVPRRFMDTYNRILGSGTPKAASRVIIDVNSPGDIAIQDYLEAHDLETAGDKSASAASFMLKIVAGVVMSIGIVITVLSLFILLLSISLLMEKNRQTLHSLLMLGYDLRDVSAPYRRIVTTASAAACLLAVVCTLWLRSFYSDSLQALGADSGNIWAAPLTAVILTAITITMNLQSVKKQVRSSWRR